MGVCNVADLWQDVKKSVDKLTTTINVKSKEVVQVSKVKKEIDELKNKMQAHFPALGEVTYHMYREGNIDQGKIDEVCREIAALDEQIKQKENELKRIYRDSQEARGKRFCPYCEFEIPVDARFCSQCGKNLPNEVKTEINN